MSPIPDETADLVTFTEEIFNGKLHFLHSVNTCSSDDLSFLGSCQTLVIELFVETVFSFYRGSRPAVFLGKGVIRKICSKFTRKHPCRSAISIMLQSKSIEITLRHGCFPANLLQILRTSFPKNTSRRLILLLVVNYFWKKIHFRCLIMNFC